MARTDEASIARIETGVAGLMRHLGMRPDGPEPVRSPIWLERSEVLRSTTTGVFTAAVEAGHTVAKGALIGQIADFHGRVIEEVVSPFAGEVLYVIGTPAISKGEPGGVCGVDSRGRLRDIADSLIGNCGLSGDCRLAIPVEDVIET